MPSEVGVGYQGPPEVQDAYGPDVERERSLEDYVSRRIFASLSKSSNQYILHRTETAISWDAAASTDSSGLFPASGTTITIPEGARGDYLLSLQSTWSLKAREVAYTLWITKNGITIGQIETNGGTGSIFTDMAAVEGDIIVANVYITGRPDDSPYVDEAGYNIAWSGGGRSPATSFRIRRLL